MRGSRNNKPLNTTFSTAHYVKGVPWATPPAVFIGRWSGNNEQLLHQHARVEYEMTDSQRRVMQGFNHLISNVCEWKKTIKIYC